MLFYTSNGGTSWTSTSIPKPYILADVSFSDAHHGWLLASQGPATAQEPIDLYHTSDSGKTWSQVLSKAESNKLLLGIKTGMAFVNSSTGWITVDNGQHPGQVVLYITHDGGHSWQLQSVPVPRSLKKYYARPLAPTFSSAQKGLMPVVFSNGKTVIYTTQNGGQSWQSSTPVPVSQVVSMSVVKGTIYLTDGTTIYDSNDNGQSWGRWHVVIKSGEQIGDVTANGAYVAGNGDVSIVELNSKENQ
ncbi:YCF48-related protein [Alicyclobacillus sp. ALC3]|uniref:YCF48-related protein n=1 Tax=Alicyclobacillus sp. ALC3 TaxID=2796143 RepID=UPI002379678A|nr:YCF48-related protein [Alicyclobacillus sp. ALC3]WDL96442.1 hypothetical protein JC200_19285 [Alicyclobacillus sp. ALC3]